MNFEYDISLQKDFNLSVLNNISEEPCGYCGGKMLVGEERAAGICSDCYWKAHEEIELGED